jgi:hypothetical protein
MGNLYEPLSKEEQLKKERFKKEIAERQEAIIRQAAECLADPKFKKYQEEFEAFKRDVFNKLDTPIDPDPIRDAHYLRSCINTIIVLDKLLTAPAKDKRR